MFKIGRSAIPAKSSQVKSWVREAFRLSEEAVVVVSELKCGEPGCPPVETVIAVLTDKSQSTTFKILKPLDAIAFGDIALLTTLPSSGSCPCDDCDEKKKAI
jgi:hypothetical protein